MTDSLFEGRDNVEFDENKTSQAENKKGNLTMNATVISKPNVEDTTLDLLATELPTIIAEVLEVPGGNLAPVKPGQISLEFTQASPRDVGSDIRIMVYAKNNNPRKSTENDRAKAILDKTVSAITASGKKYSVDIRLYLMDIGTAEHCLNE